MSLKIINMLIRKYGTEFLGYSINKQKELYNNEILQLKKDTKEKSNL